MNESTLDSWFIGLITALLALLLWRIVAAGRNKPGRFRPFHFPSGVNLRPQALLSDTELLLYNLIRMAVQDRYLVFVQVPLWKILSVEGEGELRTQVLRRIALKRVDFVLVHPGSRVVEQVVQLDEGLPADSNDQVRRREVQTMVQAAGIRFTTLNARPTYSIQELERLLGLSDPE